MRPNSIQTQAAPADADCCMADSERFQSKKKSAAQTQAHRKHNVHARATMNGRLRRSSVTSGSSGGGDFDGMAYSLAAMDRGIKENHNGAV